MRRIPRSPPWRTKGESLLGGTMFYVYILKSDRNGRLYNGFTIDLKKRLSEHNSGLSFATKPYLPWKLVFYCAFESEDLAKDFERYLKTGSGWAFAKKRFIKKYYEQRSV